MSQETSPETVLRVSGLSIAYQTRKALSPAVRNVSFDIERGRTLGIVGESGCGKSTVAFGVVNFLGSNGRITGGSVMFEGEELVGRSRRALSRLQGDRITMVYQDPMAALNPSLPIIDQLSEVLTCHHRLSTSEAQDRCLAMLRRVHMPDPADVLRRYPHQISGGQQQRVVIAMAMLNNPSLLIMDEPTTALDVTVEAAVLDLVEELKEEFNTGILFISHNLGVVARVSDNLCVMYAGQMVERGTVEDIFKQPAHPYTRGLLRCVPRLGAAKASSSLHPIPGRVPPPLDRPLDACVFAPRCRFAAPQCLEAWPESAEISPGHTARCCRTDEVLAENGARKIARPASGDEAPETAGREEPLLSMENIKIYYEQEANSVRSLFGLEPPQFVKAVDNISLSVSRGKTLGIVGESGCGKSTLVKGLIGLERIMGGAVEFLSLDINRHVSQRETAIIRQMQMVFQNPDATLNPAYTVGRQIERPIRKFGRAKGRAARQEALRLLKAVRLGSTYYDRYPRQLSGGEKQRVGIARALASRPDLVICDEPVSALDVSVQAAVLNLLLEIQQVFGTTLIFIAHDLSVVRYFSDDVAVMYLGQIMEAGPAETIYAPPYHPYTEALLSAVPIPDPEAEQESIRLTGNVPSALNPPPGCRFHTRCPRRSLAPEEGRVCQTQTPPWQQVDGEHHILCHIPLDRLAALDSVIRTPGSTA